MELDELHVHELGPRLVRERLAVAGVFPAVARDPVRAADPAGREHDRARFEDAQVPALAVVPERRRPRAPRS
jgi:hypothetical protein